MSVQFGSLNIWAILVCILSNMIIGALWYSPLLFGNIWLKLVGKKTEDISKDDANRSMMLSIIPAALSVLFLALLLSMIKLNTILDAVLIGSIVSIGFNGMGALNLVFFEDRSLKLTILNVGYSFVSLNIAAIILSVWK